MGTASSKIKMGLFGDSSSDSENYGSKLRPYAGGETLGSEADSFSSSPGLGAAGGDFETQVAVEQQKLQFACLAARELARRSSIALRSLSSLSLVMTQLDG